MGNGVTVTVAVNLKPEKADSFFNELLPVMQKQTLAFKGVLSVKAVRQIVDPTKILFIDIFESVEAAESYFAWRKNRGDVEVLEALMTGPLVIDIWPESQDA